LIQRRFRPERLSVTDDSDVKMRLNVIFPGPFFGGCDGQFLSAYYKSFGRSKKNAEMQAAAAGVRVSGEKGFAAAPTIKTS